MPTVTDLTDTAVRFAGQKRAASPIRVPQPTASGRARMKSRAGLLKMAARDSIGGLTALSIWRVRGLKFFVNFVNKDIFHRS